MAFGLPIIPGPLGPGSGRDPPPGWAEPASLPGAFSERPVVVMDTWPMRPSKAQRRPEFSGLYRTWKVVLNRPGHPRLPCLCGARSSRSLPKGFVSGNSPL